jgi:putative acetyltransferase
MHPTPTFAIQTDDLTSNQTRALLTYHLEQMHANSPAGSVFALDLSGLLQPEITVWSAWSGDTIAGIGALKNHDGKFGEIKSMRTHPDFLRCGVGALLLDHIIDAAWWEDLTRVSLETGTGPAFEPAISLYLKRGFVPGDAFADYEPSGFNQFLHLNL